MTEVQFQLNDDEAIWPATIWAHVWCEVNENVAYQGGYGSKGFEYDVRIDHISIALTLDIAGHTIDVPCENEDQQDVVTALVFEKIDADPKWFRDMAIEAFQRGN